MHLSSPYILVLVFVLAYCWVAPFTPMVLSINSVDEFALIALKAHITYDSQGILATNWSTESSHCNWYGISCSAPEQRVSAINLSNMGLEGTIAPHVANLSFLVSLDLSNNYFHASLPKDIGNCKELQWLNLFNNNLVGSIPGAICNLSKLEELYLGNNQFTGEIPRKMSHLLTLKILSFSMNNLTVNHLNGKIPASLGQCTKLQSLSLQNNSLTGEIPQSLFNISSMKFLILAVNDLEGEISSSLSHCRELQVLSLSFNQFTGGIPQAVGILSNLERLYLAYNKLVGRIPEEIGNLSNLKYLGLSSNGLSGPIPTQLFNSSSLQGIFLSNNSLFGSLPMDICKHLPNLQWLDLSLNQLIGQLPTTLSLCGELLTLVLPGNKFTGSIPREIGNLSKLEWIFLGRNSITEYGLKGIVSIKGDIYSYGIMLIETFVRKKPTDEMFVEELTLKSWVESSANNIMEVIDASLLIQDKEECFALKQACFSSIVTLALDCTVESPEKRINMKDVVVRLKKILNQIVNVSTPKERGYGDHVPFFHPEIV